VPNYARVKYANVYPGVDLVYYGNQRQLEYDFVVQPGADPRRIRLALPSAANLRDKPAVRSDRNGDLVVSTSGGEVRFHKPVVYQPGTGDGALSRVARVWTADSRFVDGRYLLSGNRISFEVANYDKTRPLVIDPTLAYSTYLGGSGGDQAVGIAVDTTGNAYVTGVTFSSDFPATPGAFQTHNRGDDGFVSKLNATGSALAYSTYVGGSGEDQGIGIAVDSSGSAYVTGQTFSSDFPITQGAFQTIFGGGISNAFVSKLNAAGSALLYSTYLGGSLLDYPSGIAVDISGNAYVAGLTESDDFPTTPGAFQTTFAGPRSNEDAFITKIDTTGSALVYSTYLGGNNLDEAHGIALDVLGNAYVTGRTVSSDFPITPSAFQTTFSGHGEAFVSKLNPTGSTLLYSSYLGGMGGSSGEEGGSVAVDGSGNCYVTGGTGSSNFPVTPGAFQTTLRGPFNAFVSKFNAVGSALLYSTYLGGSGDHDQGDYGLGLALDASGGVFVTGLTSSSDFPTTSGAFQTTYGGNFDAFFSKLNTAGSALQYSTYLGGSEPEDADILASGSIAVDVSGNVYVTGGTDSSNFPITPGALQTRFTGSVATGGEAFVSKFSFGIPFSHFGGGLLIDPDAGVFYLSGGFKLGPGGSINPSTQPVTFSVGSYSVTLPPGSFVKYKTGYVYQKRVNHIFLCVFIKFTSTPGSYALLANRIGGTLTSTTSLVPVTLAIGNDSGTAQMNARFN
jgi:hypothetical protein